MHKSLLYTASGDDLPPAIREKAQVAQRSSLDEDLTFFA